MIGKQFRQLTQLVMSGLIWIALTAGPAMAHFDLGTHVRNIVLTQTAQTTEAYLRVPLPLLFGDILSGQAADPEGFLHNRGTAQTPQMVLSVAAIEAHRAAFAARLARSLDWRIGGAPVAARVRAYTLHPAPPLLKMTTPAAAQAGLALPGAVQDVPIAQGYIDMAVSLSGVAGRWPLTVRAGFATLELPEGVAVDNHIVDQRGSAPHSYARPGQLDRPLMLPRTAWGRAAEYVYQGGLHILEGIDHVFLVVAMALGSMHGLALLGNITAFTLGHAVTLVAGFLGYAPTAPWFIPAVEAAIAATIVIAAVSSFYRVRSSALIYTLIGLLHGFGFSFVLGNVLGRESPDLIPALAAFTVGIELGQLLIVGGVLALSFGLARVWPRGERILRGGTLASLALIACWMMIERVPAIFAG